jgi:N-acetylmuramoyl-L-alanine amidase
VLLAILLSAWPAADAQLHPVTLPAKGERRLRVFIDAGHGAPGNEGNHGCFCQLEQDHTLRVARQLAAALTGMDRFELQLSRGDDFPKYQARIAAAEAFKADVVISLHSDARGEALPLSQGDGGVCWQNLDEPGFAVLWSDDGPATAARAKLGRAIGAAMREAGFLAYSGINYTSLYRQDSVEPSGWIDLRPLKKSVYFLRASKIPTVIIETHHALDPREVARWDEPKTIEALAAAVARSL